MTASSFGAPGPTLGKVDLARSAKSGGSLGAGDVEAESPHEMEGTPSRRRRRPDERDGSRIWDGSVTTVGAVAVEDRTRRRPDLGRAGHRSRGAFNPIRAARRGPPPPSSRPKGASFHLLKD